MDLRSRSISLRNKIVISFTIIMTLTILTIAIFVKNTFQSEFGKYVDESNKEEVEHLIFDMKSVYKDDSWDIDLIKQLGTDAIKKGIALEVYDANDKLIWSVLEDEKSRSNETLNNIRNNMKSIEQNWNSKLREYKVPIQDTYGKILGYEKIIHYESLYYMENDIMFLNIINTFMKVISIISIGSIIIISLLISKSISKPIEKVHAMAKTIGDGKYRHKIEYESNIKEVEELISSINKLSIKLNEQEELRKRLTTDISHELRTPLTSIQGHLDAIIDGIWEATPERLLSIREEVDRLSDLVGELRYLAKFDSEKNKLQKTYTNLGELVRHIIYNYESRALKKNITINYELDDMFVNIDKNQFSQVIVNLISNAIKYTNRNGYITIKNYKDRNSVNISIKDNGIGIPEGDIDYIFERFYRVDKSRNKDTGGIGVGLTIANSIINSHNGEIIVISKPDEGSEFIVKLPREG